MNHLASLEQLSPEAMIEVGFDNPLRLIGVDPAAWRRRTPHMRWDGATRRFVGC